MNYDNGAQTQERQSQSTSGRVEAVNDSGFKVGTDWFNFTKKDREAGVRFPASGDMVAVTYHFYTTGNGRQMRMVDDYTTNMSAPAQSSPARSDGFLKDDKPVVTRMGCLNAAIAAARLMNDRARPDEGQVWNEEAILGLAERIVAWATWGGGSSGGTEGER